jgi:hypothetical protein
MRTLNLAIVSELAIIGRLLQTGSGQRQVGHVF